MTDYHHMYHDGYKIQVDSAIRDGGGAKIDSTYVKKSELSSTTVGTATHDGDGNQISTTYVKLNDLVNLIYPVGSIYTSVNNTNPSTIYSGTTWVAFGAGRVPVGVDANHAIGDTGGGAYTQSLTESNMPAHTHNVSGSTSNVGIDHTHEFSWEGSHKHSTGFAGTRQANMGAGAKVFCRESGQADSGTGFSLDTSETSISISGNTGGTSSSHSHTLNIDTDSKGSGTAFSIEQPWIAVYMWKRTA